MGQIKSDKAVAENLATNLSIGTEMVLGYSAATKDGDTTLNGNADASSAIDGLTKHANAIAQVIEGFSKCISQIDSNFQENDSKVSKAIEGLESSGWSEKTMKSNQS